VTLKSTGAIASTSESNAPSCAVRAVPLPSPGSVSTKYSAAEMVVLASANKPLVPRTKRKSKAVRKGCIKRIYFTVAPVDSMVTVPPMGTARGSAVKLIGMGPLVVVPLIK